MSLSQAAPARHGGIGRAPRRRAPPSRWALARRRMMIGTAKRVLPMVALALLCTVVLWPDLSRWAERARLRGARFSAQVQTGELLQAVYHGVDTRGRPYTLTAPRAREASPERVDLDQPKADMLLAGDRWLMVQSRQGVFRRGASNLDLSGDVQLYRDDGLTITTDSANVDLRASAAAGGDKVHVEGPFGTLDAQGFTLLDHGSAIQFPGPGRLVLNGRR